MCKKEVGGGGGGGVSSLHHLGNLPNCVQTQQTKRTVTRAFSKIICGRIEQNIIEKNKIEQNISQYNILQ